MIVNLTLAMAINMCHSMKAMKVQLRVMTTRSETDNVTVDILHDECRSETARLSRFANCRNYGSKHQPRQCPAYGKHVTSRGNEVILQMDAIALLPLGLT